MDAEQMRVELESFVNKGLRKGLKGWPIKQASTQSQEALQTYCTMPTALALFQGVKEGPLQVPYMGQLWGQKLIMSDIRPIVNFSVKNRFDVTADHMGPLYH